eukprot:Filipodium_phascolosomae@DN2252_c0_g1_i1.p1
MCAPGLQEHNRQFTRRHPNSAEAPIERSTGEEARALQSFQTAVVTASASSTDGREEQERERCQEERNGRDIQSGSESHGEMIGAVVDGIRGRDSLSDRTHNDQQAAHDEQPAVLIEPDGLSLPLLRRYYVGLVHSAALQNKNEAFLQGQGLVWILCGMVPGFLGLLEAGGNVRYEPLERIARVYKIDQIAPATDDNTHIALYCLLSAFVSLGNDISTQHGMDCIRKSYVSMANKIMNVDSLGVPRIPDFIQSNCLPFESLEETKKLLWRGGAQVIDALTHMIILKPPSHALWRELAKQVQSIWEAYGSGIVSVIDSFIATNTSKALMHRHVLMDIEHYHTVRERWIREYGDKACYLRVMKGGDMLYMNVENFPTLTVAALLAYFDPLVLKFINSPCMTASASELRDSLISRWDPQQASRLTVEEVRDLLSQALPLSYFHGTLRTMRKR